MYINKRAIFRGREHVHICHIRRRQIREAAFIVFTRRRVDRRVCILYIVVAYVETHEGRTVYDDYAIRPMSASRTIIFFLLKRIYLSPSMRDVYIYITYTYILYQFIRTNIPSTL